MVVSSIGSRRDLTDLAALLAALAFGFRRRTEPLDADAAVLDQLAVEMALVAEKPGAWPHDVLSKGRVLVWAASIMQVVSHVEEQTGHELEATLGGLRRKAAQLQGHATGLRGTGEWAVAGEMVAPDEPTPDPEPTPEELFELAETQPITPLKPRAKP